MAGLDKVAFQGTAFSDDDPVKHAFEHGVRSVTEPVGEPVHDSPNNPDAGYPPDTEFPVPLDIPRAEVEPGAVRTSFYPDGFEGGTGSWRTDSTGPTAS